MFGREMQKMVDERGTVTLIAAQDAQADACRLYRFADGFEVIETNAGVVTEADEGFHDLKEVATGGQNEYPDGYIHTSADGHHYRHGDGAEVDGEGNPL